MTRIPVNLATEDELSEITLFRVLARSLTSNRQEVESRRVTGVLGVLAALRETLLPVR